MLNMRKKKQNLIKSVKKVIVNLFEERSIREHIKILMNSREMSMNLTQQR